jgi:hypothetical protein
MELIAGVVLRAAVPADHSTQLGTEVTGVLGVMTVFADVALMNLAY